VIPQIKKQNPQVVVIDYDIMEGDASKRIVIDKDLFGLLSQTCEKIT
jgi:hypothetical protein